MKNRKNIFIMIFIMFFTFYNVKAEGEATLKNIKVNGVECSCTGYECSVSLTAESATITYDLVDSNAKVDRLSGFKVDLLSEITTIKITVTNELNDEKIENAYNINITKKEKENDLSLKSLRVNGSAMKVSEVVPNDGTAKVIKEEEYTFEENAKTLSANFYIQAANGEKLEYGVIATRKEKPDTTLKSITLDYGTIEFDEKTLEYELTVPYNINELNIEAEANNKDAKVDIKNDTLIVGENDIVITVTSQKSKTEYKIHVTREENIDKSIANLSELKIDEYNKLDFDENVLEYTLNFNNIPSKLTIHAKSKDSDSKISILQNENLKDGSKVIVKNELNEKKVSREYILVIKKLTGVSNNKTVVLIAIIALVITMGVLLFLDIHSKKSEKKRYLKKVFDLRHKIEKMKKEGKIIPRRKRKSKKVEKKEEKEEEELEII